jgi:hypothetical protein
MYEKLSEHETQYEKNKNINAEELAITKRKALIISAVMIQNVFTKR